MEERAGEAGIAVELDGGGGLGEVEGGDCSGGTTAENVTGVADGNCKMSEQNEIFL